MSKEQELIIYTDGAALGNPGKGGYGVVMKWGPARKELSKGFRYTTNNRMELLAVIVALESLTKYGIKISLFTDSQYVFNSIDKKWIYGWQKKGWKDKKNVDLWMRYLELSKHYDIKVNWVKGHAGVPENEVCDVLATEAAKNGPWDIDRPYELENPIK